MTIFEKSSFLYLVIAEIMLIKTNSDREKTKGKSTVLAEN